MSGVRASAATREQPSLCHGTADAPFAKADAAVISTASPCTRPSASRVPFPGTRYKNSDSWFRRLVCRGRKPTSAVGATAFADFITSAEGQAIIGDFGMGTFGMPLFVADAGKAEDNLITP